MKCFPPSPVARAVTLSLIGFLPIIASAQPKLSTEKLREAGVSAYKELPDIVTPNHVSPFAESVQYFFAYEQKMYRKKKSPDQDLMRAMRWLYSEMDAFVYSKGDSFRHRSTKDLLDKGLRKYREIHGNDQIIDIPTFISASANLYAYIQVANNRNSEAMSAFEWLQQKRHQEALITSGGKGDKLSTWVPTRSKPRLGLESQRSDQELVPVFPDLVVDSLDVVQGEGSAQEKTTAEQLQEAYGDLDSRHRRIIDAFGEMRRDDEALIRKYIRLETRASRLESRLAALEKQISTRTADRGTDENLRYRVILTSVNDNKIQVIKAVRSLTGLGLKESKEQVDGAPTRIAENVSLARAKSMKSKLQKAGARVEILLSGENH